MRPSPDDHRESELDLVRVYLDQIGRHRLLDADEEVQLGALVQQGVAARTALAHADGLSPTERRRLRADVRRGEDATAAFVRSNLRLVVSVARRYRRSGVPLLDLIQEGNVGLLRAVEKFDGRKGFKFSTYATWWIRQAIGRGVIGAERTIRIPVHAAERRRHVLALLEEAELAGAGRPSEADLAEATGLDEAQVRQILTEPGVVASLDQAVGEDVTIRLGDVVPDPGVDVERAATAEDHRRTIERLLEVLDDRERRIVRLRFGLVDGEAHSLPEVAADLHLSRERIRQLEGVALSKLRHPANEIRFTDLVA